ncbi:LexA repressor [Streptomyces microflavus]
MQVVEAKGRAGRPPGTRANRVGLTSRQAAIIHFIEQQVGLQGYPPSMREIGQAVGLKSSSSVSHQLMSLERKGFLYRDPHRPRAYRVRARWTDLVHGTIPLPDFRTADVPLLGRIAAGTPILAEEAVEDPVPVGSSPTLASQVLMPHNPAYQPIPGDNATILGKVVSVIRAL